MRVPVAALAACSALLLVASCSRERVESVERENLFSLAIGKMEDQVDLFGIEGRSRSEKTRIAMRDGLFYIADGAGAKVSGFTSYGDLLSMIYNDAVNPAPLTLRTESEADGVVTRRAVAYPLNSVGELAVDSQKNIYVEDRLPPDRRVFDREKRVLLDSVILRFDKDGRFVEYLGREGVGGSPFPLILSVEVSVDDELAVVCRVSAGWEVYWFDENGDLLYLVKVDAAELPAGPDAGARPSMDALHAAPDRRRLYLKMDYYRDEVDESTKTRSGIGYAGSLLWSMDVEKGVFTSPMEVPPLEVDETENDRKVISKRIFGFLGAAAGGKLFFLAPEDSGYALLVLEEATKIQRRGTIRVDQDELAFNDFGLSRDGILYGLLASDFEAKVVWWRTDRLGSSE